MKKIIFVVLLFLLLACQAQGAMTNTITTKPNMNWWKGGTKDVAWKWAKEVEDTIEASTLYSGTEIAFDAAASTITLASDGTADDLTISVTGATNSSLFIKSSGIAADALGISTSAGGMDITVAGAAAGEDLDITSDSSINITATEAAEAAIKLSASGTVAGNAVQILTTNGGIQIAAAGVSNGDVTITSGDDVIITSTGALTIDNTGGGTFKGTLLPDSMVKKTVTTGSLTSADCGYVLGVSQDAQTITLPATVAGLTFTIMNIAADGVAEITVELDNADQFIGAGLAPADGEAIINTKGTADYGDYITVTAHASGWIITAMNGIWAEAAP